MMKSVPVVRWCALSAWEEELEQAEHQRVGEHGDAPDGDGSQVMCANVEGVTLVEADGGGEEQPH